MGLILLVVLSGCSVFQNYTVKASPARSSILAGDYESALTVFPESSARGRDEVLLRLERATILQGLGRFEESMQEFARADARIRDYEDRAVISATKTAALAGSLLINEQVMSYEGEDFEKIMLHALNAVNFLMLNDLEGARVEVRRAYQRQEELSDRHEKELEEARNETGFSDWERSFEQADREAYAQLKDRASTVYSVYHNAFASYISALVYELAGEDDEAYIDLKKAYDAYPSSRSIQMDLVRLSRKMAFRDDADRWARAFGKQDAPLKDSIDVFVLFSCGLAPLKEPLSLPIPIHHGFVMASMPVYRFTPSGITGALVSAGGTRGESSTVCDIDAIAARNLMDEFPLLFVKQVARAYIKAQAVNGLAREHGDTGALLGTLFAVITEQADLRTWSTLPKQTQVSRIFVPGSSTELTVQALPSGQTATVAIPPGARHVIVICRATDAGLSIYAQSY